MYATLTSLLDRLDSPMMAKTDVFAWGSPVPSFGDLSCARVATLGLNPSNREFVDERGAELGGPSRRFHTLSSLGLSSWADAHARHLELILDSCASYFQGNPYDRWFKVLDRVVQGANASFYDEARPACHLDLIPFATERKWTDLAPAQRRSLLREAGDTLGALLRASPVEVLILNGASVVAAFESVSDAEWVVTEMPDWALPRRKSSDVMGVAYSAMVDKVAGVGLVRPVLVLGFNHNLQSSFGVTTSVISSIREWVASVCGE